MNRMRKKGKFMPQKNKPKTGLGSDTNKPRQLGKPGKKAIGGPIAYNGLPGHGKFKAISVHEMYDKGWITLYHHPKYEMVVHFEPRGTANVPRASGIIALLRLMMADTKGPWTEKPFWFTTCHCPKKQVGKCKHGKWIKPTDFSIKEFDRLTRLEQRANHPINSQALQPQKSAFDDKLGFEDKAQINAEFEKRFSS